jgi:hypothetical protein
MWLFGLDWAGSRRGPLAGSCEHGNELLSSIKVGGGDSWAAEWISESQEGLCPVDLVSYLVHYEKYNT